MTLIQSNKVLLTYISLMLMLMPAPSVKAQDQLLPAEQAFALSTRVIDAHTIEASWRIAPGYYLYRHKFSFELLDGAVTLKDPIYPKGKIKDDPNFGRVETYERTLTIRLPLERKKDAGTIRLRIGAQGCNIPIGVCYPPMSTTVDLTLPAANETTSLPASSTGLDKLAALITPSSGVTDEYLHPDQAFRPSLANKSAGTLVAYFRIAPGHYLYRSKFGFRLIGAKGVRLAEAVYPKGKIKDDANFGRSEVYLSPIAITLPLVFDNNPAHTAVLEMIYQGCADERICYPPQTKQIKLNFTTGSVSIADGQTLAGTYDDGADRTTGSLTTKQYLLAILTAFGVGLLLTFTPCVLPMVPILSSVIVGEGHLEISKLRGGLLATAYVFGTSVTYVIAGVFAGATGGQLQAYFQNLWGIGIFAAVMVVLALSMFGLYTIQLPQALQTRLHLHSSKMRRGDFVGVFIMGLLAALIVGACVSPLFISALAVAIANQDPVLGGAIMFAMSWGMGIPLIALGLGMGFLVPRAGAWMERIKHIFGILLLAVAVYMLGLLPEVPALLLWGILLIPSAIYLGAFRTWGAHASGWHHLLQGASLIILIWGAMAIVGGSLGGRDILRPLDPLLQHTQPRPATDVQILDKVTSLAMLDQRLSEARSKGKMVMLDFYADWCVDCLRMDKTTFADPAVRAALARDYISLKIDVGNPNDRDMSAIKRRYSIFGPPAMLFIDASGRVRKDMSFYGYRDAREMLAVLNQR